MNTRAFTLICLCLVAPTSAFAEALLKNTYPIENVREIVASGGAIVELQQGDSESLHAVGTKEVLEFVSVDLTGERLTLKLKHNRKGFFDWFGSNDDEVKFIVQVKDLSRLELSGAASAKIGSLQGSRFKLDAHGAGHAKIGELRIEHLSFDISGAGHIKVDSIYGKNLRADISGAARMEVNGEGSLDEIHLQVSGASKYFGKGVESKSVYANASGASHIDVRASETLEAHASGASHINYFGNPRTNRHSSGASGINQKGE